MRNHLVVFVKAPMLGAVKTRLAADIGTSAAWRFYRATVARLLRRVARDPRWTCWLAVTPDRYAGAGRFWPADLARLAQGAGDLGARMARPMRSLPPGPVVIVGSDIPDLGVDHLARAFRALDRHHLVFGPAADGGYWLVGARRRPLPFGLFRRVRWSGPKALADTLAGLAPGTDVGFLEELADIDNGADLERWRAGRGGP